MADPALTSAKPRAFAALHLPGFRHFLLLSAAAMMADNIEHVITYWAAFQKFHSATLGGIAVVSHWLPYLLLSIPVGALADRIDPRRLIQAGMLLFVGVSVAWATLISTDTLQVWHAWLLLVLHGIAGVLWMPAAQLLLWDIAGPTHLPSAVRLNATARYLGMLAGPAVGGQLLLLAGPAHGLFINALFYVPFLIWLWKAPYGHAVRGNKLRPALGGLNDVIATLKVIAGNRTLLSMMSLAGGAAFLVGNAYQAQMPKFAQDLGHGRPDMTYRCCWRPMRPARCSAASRSRVRVGCAPGRAALMLAMGWCCALAAFAASGSYALALGCLPPPDSSSLRSIRWPRRWCSSTRRASRGRVIGVYAMSSLGLRTFSGVSVGLLGSIVGVHACEPGEFRGCAVCDPGPVAGGAGPRLKRKADLLVSRRPESPAHRCPPRAGGRVFD